VTLHPVVFFATFCAGPVGILLTSFRPYFSLFVLGDNANDTVRSRKKKGDLENWQKDVKEDVVHADPGGNGGKPKSFYLIIGVLCNNNLGHQTAKLSGVSIGLKFASGHEINKKSIAFKS